MTKAKQAHRDSCPTLALPRRFMPRKNNGNLHKLVTSQRAYVEPNGRRTKSNADTLRKAYQPTLSATSAASGLGTTSKSLASHAEILRGIDEGGKNTQPQAMIISRTAPSEDGCGRGCIS